MILFDKHGEAHSHDPVDESTPFDAAVATGMRDCVSYMLGTISPREATVLRLRFGIGTGTERTLKQVGEALGISAARVRQIEQKAFRKLRHPSRCHQLLSFLDA